MEIEEEGHGKSSMERDLEAIRKDGKAMVLGMEQDTKDRALLMAKKREAKIKQLASQMLAVQLNKIDSKLKYLSEYENAIWNEKRSLEVFQQQLLADRIELFSQRGQIQVMLLIYPKY